MKKVVFGILLLFAFAKVDAQTSMSIGYLAPYGIEPGINITGNFKFINLPEPSAMHPERLPKYLYKGFWQPEVAFFSRPKYNSNLFLSAGRGIKRNKRGSKNYSTASFGLGYLAQFEIVTTTVQLGSADIEKERERRDYFLPSVSYTFGRNVKPSWGWYLKGMYGKQFSSKYESSGLLMFGFGLHFIPVTAVLVNDKR